MLVITRSMRMQLGELAPSFGRLLSSSRQLRQEATSRGGSGSSSSSNVTSYSSPPSERTPIDPLERLQRRRNLFEHLASLPDHGVGTRVRQYRWAVKGLDVPRIEPLSGPPQAKGLQPKNNGHLCYYTITRVVMKPDLRGGKPFGKVWGKLTWRGKLIDEKPEGHLIRDGLKYKWGSAN